MVLDDPDEKTLRYVGTHSDLVSAVHVIDGGGSPAAGKRGVELATGRFITFLDAGDLLGLHWLGAAYAAASSAEAVYHPEYVVAFDPVVLLLRTESLMAGAGSVADLLEFNPWHHIPVFAHRSLLVGHPFAPTPNGRGLAARIGTGTARC